MLVAGAEYLGGADILKQVPDDQIVFLKRYDGHPGRGIRQSGDVTVQLDQVPAPSQFLSADTPSLSAVSSTVLPGRGVIGPR
ncbi:hypothetical protein D3C72_1709250 [compost metagenome]